MVDTLSLGYSADTSSLGYSADTLSLGCLVGTLSLGYLFLLGSSKLDILAGLVISFSV